MPLSPVSVHTVESHRNQRFLVGHHREYVDSYHLAYITSRQSVVIAGYRAMKDIRRLCSVRFFQVWRRLFAISKP